MTMIASVGPDLPLPLLAATGRYAGALGWDADRATPQADQWLESRFAPWTRSILEDWATGALDHLESVLFSRGDDNAQRLYYYACELQTRGLIKGPTPLIFDLARIDRPSSLARTIKSVRKLAALWDVDEAALEAAIADANRQSIQFPQVPSSKTCLLVGTAPPDRRLHAMIEAAGWMASGDTLSDQWARQDGHIDVASGDPCAAIGHQLHKGKSGPRAFYDRAAATLEQARATDASAAVLWFIEEEEGLVWQAPAQQRALEEAGIPVLMLARRDWRAQGDEAARIAEFLGGLNA